MTGVLPTPSLKGVVDYVALAVGIILGFAILNGPMDNLESGLRKQGGSS
jgi:hypothetical protein